MNNLEMQIDFAREVSRLPNLSPALQKNLFLFNDDIVNYYLASRDDLIYEIQEELVSHERFLEQWAKGKNRPTGLIEKATAYMKDEVNLILAGNNLLSPIAVKNLLSSDSWLVVWKLWGSNTLTIEEEKLALVKVLLSLNLDSKDQFVDELLERVSSKEELWLEIITHITLDNFYLLRYIPRSLYNKYDSIIFQVLTDLTNEINLSLGNVEIDLTLIEKLEKGQIGLTESMINVILKWKKIMEFLIRDSNLPLPHVELLKEMKLNLAYQNALLQLELLGKLREEIEETYPKVDKKVELLYLDSVLAYQNYSGNDILACEIALTYREEIKNEFYIRSTTILDATLLLDLSIKLNNRKKFIELERLIDRNLGEVKVTEEFIDYLLIHDSKLLLDKQVYQGYEEYIIKKCKNLKSILANDELMSLLLKLIEMDRRYEAILNLLPEWECSYEELIYFLEKI